MAVGEILRFATAGSVDDGKSSLIGRLLYDSKSILEDQMRSIEHASRQRGSEQVELALLTDGLRAEREQNITIDVAYRYFSTDKRKFIIADTPGHIQYTRNMVTGTSTADLSVILIDARKGVLSQSKRHAAISALLGIRHLVVAVNKMDLVGFDEDVFEGIAREFTAFVNRLGNPTVKFIPISALLGDNVVDSSTNMPWFQGQPLLRYLEEVDASVPDAGSLRLPIQYVIRPNQDYRGFAGRLESGTLRVGDLAVVSSTGTEARVRSILVAGRETHEASFGQAVAVTLDREVDVSRGDLMFAPGDPPSEADRVEAIVCWMNEQPLQVGHRYLLLHGTARVSATVERVLNRVDVDTLDPLSSISLGMNDIGRIVLHTSKRLFFDPYSTLPAMGSFVLVDPGTHATVAGGMIQAVATEEASEDLVKGRVIWLDGWKGDLHSLGRELRRFGKQVIVLAGDNVLPQFVGVLLAQGVDTLVDGDAAPDGAVRISVDPLSNREALVDTILARL